MGFFSWFTQDTQRSIASKYSNGEKFPVYMIDNKGNSWYEPNYEGYGEFGGKDYYELLAEMNGLPPDRDAGIELAFSGNSYLPPNLVESPNGWVYESTPPPDCPDQGYFYA